MATSRRGFLSAVATVGVASNRPIRAASDASPVRIGMLSGGGLEGSADWDAFYGAMRQLGYEEGRNVIYDRRPARGEPELLAHLAHDLVAAKPRLIVTTGGPEALAARQATAVIPIVMIIGGSDPVAMGLAMSLARPGGNVTGHTLAIPGFFGKRLQILCEAVPAARRIGTLDNPNGGNYGPYRQELEQAASVLGVTLLPAAVATRVQELGGALNRLEQQRPDALMVHGDVVFYVQHLRLIEFAARHALPTMYGFTRDVEDGGLMAFAVEFRELFARAPVIIDKILKGANPADIPIEQPTRYGLWLNLRTAKTLGLPVPQSVLLQTLRVIQ
jgi:putative ABC transport system substrate-binding protein